MKKHFKTVLCVMLTTPVLGVTANAAPPLADTSSSIVLLKKNHYDYKTFNGSTCKPFYGSQMADFRFSRKGIRNLASTGRWVTCPVMRDDTETEYGAGLSVYLSDANGATCYFYSLTPQGVTVDSQRKTVTGNNSRVTLNFNVSKSAKMGSYALKCALPKNATLYSYKLKERYTDLNKRTDKDASFPILWPPVLDLPIKVNP